LLKAGLREEQLDDIMAQAIARHFEAIGTDELRAGEIYADDAVLEYVQSGERIRGKANIIASRQAYPGRPTAFELHRSAGAPDLQVVELTLRFDGGDPHPVVAILEFRDGKVVRERIYIAEPWDPPAYRARWVEPLDSDHSKP
jgi:SnoaL-like domain